MPQFGKNKMCKKWVKLTGLMCRVKFVQPCRIYFKMRLVDLAVDMILKI